MEQSRLLLRVLTSVTASAALAALGAAFTPALSPTSNAGHFLPEHRVICAHPG